MRHYYPSDGMAIYSNKADLPSAIFFTTTIKLCSNDRLKNRPVEIWLYSLVLNRVGQRSIVWSNLPALKVSVVQGRWCFR